MTLEICPLCDIAGCKHIRERRADLPAPDAMADPLVAAQSDLAKGLLATDIRSTLGDGAGGLLILAHLASDQGNSHEENLDAVEEALREWLSNIAIEAAKPPGE